LRRVPVSRQLRCVPLPYPNRQRPEISAPKLLVLRDGRGRHRRSPSYPVSGAIVRGDREGASMKAVM